MAQWGAYRTRGVANDVGGVGQVRLWHLLVRLALFFFVGFESCITTYTSIRR